MLDNEQLSEADERIRQQKQAVIDEQTAKDQAFQSLADIKVAELVEAAAKVELLRLMIKDITWFVRGRPKERLSIVKAGAIPALINNIKMHFTSQLVVLEALMLLNNLAIGGAAVKQEIVAEGGLHLVISVLTTHKHHLASASQACAALAGLLQVTVDQRGHPSKDAINEDAVKELLQAMRLHTTEAPFVCWACMALYKMCHPCCSPSTANDALVNGAGKVIAHLMKPHLGNGKVLEQCCRTIVCLLRGLGESTVSSTASERQRLTESMLEVVPPVAEALQLHPFNQELQLAGQKVLYELSKFKGHP